MKKRILSIALVATLLFCTFGVAAAAVPDHSGLLQIANSLVNSVVNNPETVIAAGVNTAANAAASVSPNFTPANLPGLPPLPSNPFFDVLMWGWFAFFNPFNDDQVDLFVRTLREMERLGLDIDPIVEWAVENLPLPIQVRARLHREGLYSFPIWERNMFFNVIFYVFLFGWIWM